MSGRKRSLTYTGGRCRLSGDPALAATLAHCLAVDPAMPLPFTHGFHAYPARMHPETARPHSTGLSGNTPGLPQSA